MLKPPAGKPNPHKRDMYKYLLQSVDGIQWFGIAGLLIFFGAFCFAFFRAYFLSDKKDMDYMSQLPLDEH